MGKEKENKEGRKKGRKARKIRKKKCESRRERTKGEIRKGEK